MIPFWKKLRYTEAVLSPLTSLFYAVFGACLRFFMLRPTPLFILRSLLTLITLLFVAQPWLPLARLSWFLSNDCFYVTFPILSIMTTWITWQHSRHIDTLLCRSLLISFFPVAFILSIGLILAREFHYLVDLSVGLYVIGIFTYWARNFIVREKHESNDTEPTTILSPLSWHDHGSRWALLWITGLTLVFLLFGLQNLARFAAVDEPLWLDGRIGKFWKHLSAQAMERTLVSDKPGITIVWSTGPALLVVDPSHYRDTRYEYQAKNPALKIEHFYLAFRLPLLIVITCLLPLFYLLLFPLIGPKAALISYAGITLAPILIGISKIVNPDSLLWIFAPLSLLAYLVFIEKKVWRFLVLSGVLFGLALLTKYVANFLVVFLFGLVFLYPIWKGHATPKTLKHSLQAFFIWLGIGLSVLYVAVPAFWVNPARLLTSTIFSQAFEKVAWLFITIILIVFLDQLLFKSRFSTKVIHWLECSAQVITILILTTFSLLFAFVFINGITGMPWLNFTEILTSPKSISKFYGLVSIFLAHGYPLLFGSVPLIVLGSLIAIVKTWRTSPAGRGVTERLVLILLLFILLFYLGSTINEVALINRYQIMLYPLLAILSGIGLTWGLKTLLERFHRSLDTPSLWHPTLLTLVLLLVFSPLTTPFPLSYNSSLLPNTLSVDVKDMGAGSYEAAEYLNRLPNAHVTAIWTDKSGVCKFYIGPCFDGFNFKKIEGYSVRYLVLSSGRESRIRNRVNPIDAPSETHVQDFTHLDSYYQRDDAFYTININGRSGQTVKVFHLNP